MRDNRPVNDVVRVEGVATAIGLKYVASLLFTYRCTIACKHCLFNCSPAKPSVHTSLPDAIEYLRQLHAVDRVIHIAGGEAMMFYPQLLEICREANIEGIAPHFIETNASFAVNDQVTSDRLLELKDAGVQGLLISADPYHQRFCPPDRYFRCFNTAVEVFGDKNVAGAKLSMEQLEKLCDIGRDPVKLVEFTRENPPMLVGRAGDALSICFADRPVDTLLDEMWHGGAGRIDCRQEFDPETMWEIHIDPYGNIQTCCGIIVGNAKETPLPELMATGFLGQSPIVDTVYHGGPKALLDLAISYGYTPRSGYPQKCGLCWEVRLFLRQFFPETIGPDEIYEHD
ncbi:MAG: radical SAM protein [Armatimonadota bacterium]